MNIPFLDLYNKAKEKAKTVFSKKPVVMTSAVLLRPTATKSEGEKFAKTVTPNAVRTISQESSAPAPAHSPRMVVMGRGGPAALARDLPQVVARALEPRVERTLSLELADVIEQMPQGYLKPKESFDTSRRVLLKAAEVEKGMATGKPSVTVSALYQQMPEIFMHTVPANDSSLVALPFEKVMHELTSLQVRTDQTKVQVASHYETPFLKVTTEDSERFGTKMDAVETAEFPKVNLEMDPDPATAQTLAAFEPEATTREKFVPSSMPMTAKPFTSRSTPSVPTPIPSESNGDLKAAPPVRVPFTPPPAETAAKAPAQPTESAKTPPPAIEMPKDFGTGEPAFPRVPASSGPPVPLDVSSKPAQPIRIPFKPEATAPVTPPKVELTKPEQPPAKKEAVAATAAKSGPMITLPLLPIMKSLPPMQLTGEVSTVPEEATVSFPFSLIAPQLPTGKVAISPNDFYAALPEAHRDLFLPNIVEAPVQLSLPTVLANLPGDALQMRGDQVTETPDEVFETPFSTKAAEDAKRFGAETTKGIAKPEVAAKKEEPKGAPEKEKEQPTAAATEKFDAKAAVAQACALPGISSASVVFADGLSIAGNIARELQMEGFSAMAPTLLQKLRKHMLETTLGALKCVTVYGDKSPVTFFSAGNICLTAVQSGPDLAGSTRTALASITQQLSQTYSQPEAPHVDH